MTKKLLSIIALFSLAVTNAWADANGYCGDPSVNEGKNVTWAYDNGTLTISGTGAMADFAGRDYQPWKDYRSSITSIVIENGVTGIGKSAFASSSGLTSVTFASGSRLESIGNFAIEYCPKLASIEIPASVTSIGVQTFDGCTVLTAVTFASGSQLGSIGKGAFHNCTSLTSIEIPASVTSIGNFAFYGCTGLTSITVASENAYYSSDDGVLFNKDKTTLIYYLEGKAADSYTIPDGVTSIGDNAFRYCSKLASLEIPASVTNIGNYTFFECTGLTSITVASENAYYSSDDGVLFNKDKTTLIRYPAGKTADSYTIPDGVTSIDIHAFSNCYGLTSIAIPSIVTSIGELAFYKCTGLASVVVYAQSCSLGPRAFYECANLSKIYVPGDKVDEYKATENWSTYASKIEANITANGYCGDPSVNEGKNVTWTLTGTSPNYTLTISGTGAMENFANENYQPWKDYRSSITSVVIENGVTSIGEYAFYSCSRLTTITIPSSVTSIGGWAFKYCSNLTSVTVYAPSCGLGTNAFDNCASGLKIYVFSDKVDDYKVATNWSSYESNIVGFDGSCGDPSVNEGKNVTWAYDNGTLTIIGTGAMADYVSGNPGWYSYMDNISSIVIENGVTSIGDYVFQDCSGLTSVTFASGSQLESIGVNAFYSCSKLTSVTIPASVTSIGYGAFMGCSGLTSVTFASGSQLASIGERAFCSCTNNNLTSIEIPASVKSIGGSAFYFCTGLTSVAFASGSQLESIGVQAFTSCSGLTSIEIPASVKSIGESAFSYCTGLTSVAFAYGSQLESIGVHAFTRCSGLTSIEIPASVKSIGKSAFNECFYLESVKLNSNPTIGEDAFRDIKYGATVTMNLKGNEGKTSEYWMTFYNKNYNFTADANTTVYKAAVSGSWVNLTAVDDIPADNAAILKSSNAAITMTLTASATADYSGNELKGTDVDTDASGMTYAYCLSKNSSGEVGFYKFTGNSNYGEIIPANRAYLIINDGGSGARSFYGFDVEEDIKTAIQAVETVGEDGEIYDLSGRRVVGQPRKGIYVKNGKKIVIK